MKKILIVWTVLALFVMQAGAQKVSVKWELGDVEHLNAVVMTGDEAYTSLLSTSYAQGSQIAKVTALTGSNADSGYEAVTYTPPFAAYTPSTRVEAATAGHNITFGITLSEGHKLKVTRVSFDCARVGTDGGGVQATLRPLNGTRVTLPVEILRNKITATNSTGYAHNEFEIADMVADESGLTLTFSIFQLNGTDNANPKSMAFRNVVIEGVVDEEVYDVSHYLSDFTCLAKTSADAPAPLSLYDLVKGLKNGQNTRLTTKLYAQPTDFTATLQPSLGEGYAVATDYSEATNTATVVISKNGERELGFTIGFTVSNRQPKGKPEP